MWNIITDICKITMPKNSFFFLLKFNLFIYFVFFFVSSSLNERTRFSMLFVVVILVRNIWINMFLFVLFWLFTSSRISCLSTYKNVFFTHLKTHHLEGGRFNINVSCLANKKQHEIVVVKPLHYANMTRIKPVLKWYQ